MSSLTVHPAIKLLIINPNTTSSMTASLQAPVNALLASYKDVSCDFFTGPPFQPSVKSSFDSPVPLADIDLNAAAIGAGAIPSINSPADAWASAAYCLPFLRAKIPEYDGFLVACFSEHPLVQMLGKEIDDLRRQNSRGSWRKFVIGILEASVITSLGLLAQYSSHRQGEDASTPSFGIVSTGKIWEDALSSAVHSFLGFDGNGSPKSERFAGVETTGLNATELHDLPADEVRSRMSEAAARLVSSPQLTDGERKRRKVRVICLGCAGMTGLENAVREGVRSALGDEDAKEIMIVDGVLAGTSWLIGACRIRM
ncbi:hypothetical protein D9758_012596 [Tetrapyrgos nigripes]|uniref:DCG1-like protein n=1 Tax=Tetrapyrgos nigripes TaxID=182062 RepID=A0A8H5FLU1_9AGAR|nr:hypothetical protein D9758_012596 [Tetrapyrgos nigripes]